MSIETDGLNKKSSKGRKTVFGLIIITVLTFFGFTSSETDSKVDDTLGKLQQIKELGQEVIATVEDEAGITKSDTLNSDTLDGGKLNE